MDYNIPEVKDMMDKAVTLSKEADGLVRQANLSTDVNDKQFYLAEANRLKVKADYYLMSARMWNSTSKIGA